MSPQISIHRPRGVLPKVTVRKRTLVDYQPSWLLLALPALGVLRRARTSRSQAGPSSKSRTPSSEAVGSGVGDLNVGGATGSAAPRRRRPGQVVVVTMTRLRRRPAAPAPFATADLQGQDDALR